MAPLLQVWILIPQIEELEMFQFLFAALNSENKRRVVWEMIKTSWSFQSETLRIQEVYDSVEKFVELINSRIPFYHYYIIDTRDRYVDIMQQILVVFRRIDTLSPIEIFALMTELIQTSVKSIVPELIVAYVMIWNNFQVGSIRTVSPPVQLPNHLRLAKHHAMHTSPEPFIQELIQLHDILRDECLAYLDVKVDEANILVQMEINRLRELVELAKVA